MTTLGSGSELPPLDRLLSGPVSWFADWPDPFIPTAGYAVYTVWDRADRFIYAGMSGRTTVAAARSKGPFGRLNSHASGRRSGDQFCIYVCDRLVLPMLHNRLADVASGELRLDAETKAFIRRELGFRLLPLSSPAEAFDVERHLCTGKSAAGYPLLNPH